MGRYSVACFVCFVPYLSLSALDDIDTVCIDSGSVPNKPLHETALLQSARHALGRSHTASVMVDGDASSSMTDSDENDRSAADNSLKVNTDYGVSIDSIMNNLVVKRPIDADDDQSPVGTDSDNAEPATDEDNTNSIDGNDQEEDHTEDSSSASASVDSKAAPSMMDGDDGSDESSWNAARGSEVALADIGSEDQRIDNHGPTNSDEDFVSDEGRNTATDGVPPGSKMSHMSIGSETGTTQSQPASTTSKPTDPGGIVSSSSNVVASNVKEKSVTLSSFDRVDTNHDGFISRPEMIAAMNAPQSSAAPSAQETSTIAPDSSAITATTTEQNSTTPAAREKSSTIVATTTALPSTTGIISSSTATMSSIQSSTTGAVSISTSNMAGATTTALTGSPTASNQQCQVILSVTTSASQQASTTSLVTVSFEISGAWTMPSALFTGSAKNSFRSHSLDLPGSPTKLKLHLHQDDDWSYSELGIYNSEGKICELLPNGTNEVLRKGTDIEKGVTQCGVVCNPNPKSQKALPGVINAGACNESFSAETATDYRGCQNMTVDGLACQKWTSQTPHEHDYLPAGTSRESDGLGDHNFCRNPPGAFKGRTVWCYTMDPNTRWNYCVPKTEQVAATTVAPTTSTTATAATTTTTTQSTTSSVQSTSSLGAESTSSSNVATSTTAQYTTSISTAATSIPATSAATSQSCMIILSTTTAGDEQASTTALVTTSFLIKGQWTPPVKFFTGAKKGSFRSKSFELPGRDAISKIKVMLHSDDDWGYTDIGIYNSEGKICELVHAPEVLHGDQSRELDVTMCGSVCQNKPSPPQVLPQTQSDGCNETMSSPGEYRGCQNVTVSGKACQKWSLQNPHGHDYLPPNWPPGQIKESDGLGDHNYCRKPAGIIGGSSIWCYTTDPNTRWEYCEPRKPGSVVMQTTTTTTMTLKAAAGCNETLGAERGTEYRGCQNVTVTGKICQKWTLQYPQEHDYLIERFPNGTVKTTDDGLGDHNHCRNPKGAFQGTTIWCYTNESDVRWEYCNSATFRSASPLFNAPPQPLNDEMHDESFHPLTISHLDDIFFPSTLAPGSGSSTLPTGSTSAAASTSILPAGATSADASTTSSPSSATTLAATDGTSTLPAGSTPAAASTTGPPSSATTAATSGNPSTSSSAATAQTTSTVTQTAGASTTVPVSMSSTVSSTSTSISPMVGSTTLHPGPDPSQPGGCNETLSGVGEDYRGCQNVTVTGKPCQKWSMQTPQTHNFDATMTGLGNHNFCRNPRSTFEGSTIWCYTNIPNTRWEYCNPTTFHSVLSTSTVAPASAVVSTTPSVGKKCRLKLSATTSSNKWADTGAVLKASFLVGSNWATSVFFTGSQLGRKESKIFDLAEQPKKVRLFMGDSTDGWGFKEVDIATPDGRVSCILATGGGAEYGDNPWWLDTDGTAPILREFPMSQCPSLCS
eukprot:gnl/MRDRNA2_/MRDRNA2_58293_c0_seq1.p1 gnl/MRDRNA2_/MRDRNA2_58293_c0~~gnl/MRDRNA2_/MRDRNA2_58293_c0_seq1.p1  ORF type:complete len:1441 (+),score=201.09 gnl/MRDRNA2_/MRDRNA2_58293_c0_seq1:112-4434(+)